MLIIAHFKAIFNRSTARCNREGEFDMSNSSNEEAKRFTEECVVSALLKLLEEKEYKKITLTEIAVKAGVSRNAVYRNFSSKDLILRKYVKSITLEFVNGLKNKNISTYEQYVTELFLHLCSHAKISGILIDSGLTEVLFEAFTVMKGCFDTGFESKSEGYYDNYRIGGMFFIYLTWLERGCTESPEELSEIALKVIKSKSALPKTVR